MAADSLSGIRAAPLFFAMAATLSALLLLSVTPTAGAAEQRPVTAGNGSLCSGGLNGDGDGEDGGCLTIGQAQPELEVFDLTVDLGSGVVFRRSLVDFSQVTRDAANRNANCGRDKRDARYKTCTTDARSGGGNPQQCDAHNRNNPC